MPASTSTMLTLAHAKASARLPKSVMRAHTATPTTHALRKQPRRNVPSASQPGWSTWKPKAQRPSAASSTNTARLRTMPTIHEPSVRWRMPIGARNWCLSDFDHTSSRTAYATSSWHTFTTESAIVPTSTNDACAALSSRNRDIRPIDRMPTIGQKRSSKKKNTLRALMRALRSVTAQTASSSFRQLNEDLLELRLVDLHVPDDDALGVERAEQLRQPLLGLVHRALDPAVDLDATQDARALGEPRHARGVELERDHLAEADLPLELAGGAARQDTPGLDERDLVAELVGLAHVVRRQHDRDPLLAAQPRDVGAYPHRDVGVEAERGLVEEQELGLVDQRLGQRHALLEPGRELRVRDTAVRLELGELDQRVDPAPERAAAQAVEAAVERDDLGDAQAPEERRPAAHHVEPPAQRARIADDVEPEHGHPTAIGGQQRGEDREQGGLAGAVGTEHADDRAARHRQRDAAQRDRLAAPHPSGTKRLLDVLRVDREHTQR